jgi:hypothetical protein
MTRILLFLFAVLMVLSEIVWLISLIVYGIKLFIQVLLIIIAVSIIYNLLQFIRYNLIARFHKKQITFYNFRKIYPKIGTVTQLQ